MNLDPRIPAPNFSATLRELVAFTHESPNEAYLPAYLDDEGKPCDLVGHVLLHLGAPHSAFEGHMSPMSPRHPATPRRKAMLPLLWNRLFTGNPYDDRSCCFPNMKHDRKVAEDYLVYALLNHMTMPQSKRPEGETWQTAAIRGLKSFRRFLNSETSGFLVQTQGAWPNLRATADAQVTIALQTLSTLNTKEAA